MKRYYILAVVFVLIIGLVVWLESKKVRISGSVGVPAISLGETENNKAAEKAKIYDSAKEIVSPAGFINTDENLQIKNLIGKKVVLLDFWTYSCINCQRTLPYITSWYDKYKDAGLEIIGVHTPEFAFEKEYDNVVAATKKWGVNYPVVLDNDYGTWQAYKNRYWPRKYLIDIDGYIVYDHIGEGGYDETEKKIQELLMERKDRLSEDVEVAQDITTPKDVESVDNTQRRSPETYFGSLRNDYLGEIEKINGDVITFASPKNVLPNKVYLVGDWIITPEHAEAVSQNAKVIFKYSAEKVFLVMTADEPTGVIVRRDGNDIGSAAGEHVQNGRATVLVDDLYRLVEDPDGFGAHTLELETTAPGVRLFAFTFG